MYILIMQTITTTELRTKSKSLVESLIAGKSVQLIHRSQVIGEIHPKEQVRKKITTKDITELSKLLSVIKPTKVLPKNQRGKVYRQNLQKKHGLSVS